MFGGDFDDDLFGETKDRSQKERLISYNAKICEPEWFSEPGVTEDKRNDAELHNVFKHRADLAYRRRNYQLALTEYKTCLEHVTPGNAAIRRNVYDCLTRCHLALKQHTEALQSVKLVEDLAQNFEHKTCLFYLQSKLYLEVGLYTERLEALTKNLTLHGSTPHMWLELAETYILRSINENRPTQTSCDLQSYETSSTNHSVRNSENSERCIDDVTRTLNNIRVTGSILDQLELVRASLDKPAVSTGMNLLMVVCTCLIRNRSLLHSVQRNLVSFALEQNKAKIKLVQTYIDSLRVPADIYQKCLEFVNIDVFGLESLYELDGQEKDRGDANITHQGQTPVDKLLEGWSLESFEKSWFSWHKTDLKLSRSKSDD